MNTLPKQTTARTWVWLILLATVVGFLGGSSRPDQVQLIALRPMVTLFLIPALYFLSFAQIRKAQMLISLTSLCLIWMLLQLLPLPPSLWETLAGRDTIMELDQVSSVEGVWRPTSWVPARGWNALAGMIVPVAGVLLALALRASFRMLLWLMVGLGLVDALLGVLQVLSGASSPLYFYSVTNHGSAVGLFANENHSGVFSAVVLLMIARLVLSSRGSGEPAALRLVYPPAFLLVLISTLIGGSRTGVILGVLALLIATVTVWIGFASRRKSHGLKRGQGQIMRWLASHPFAPVLGFGGVILALLWAFFVFGRAEALEEIVSRDSFEGLRFQVWPVLQQMIGAHWLFGIGFGSFEEVYHLYEPTTLLLPQYVNQAHNEWAQIIIEGGLPILILLLVLLVWIALAIVRLLRCSPPSFQSAIFWGAVFSLISIASVVDYPLRTPIFQLVGAWLLLGLALEQDGGNSAG